jgi:hypothetical protein
MQYAYVENGSIGYIGELSKIFKESNKFLKTLEWFPATIIKESPVTRKAKENEVTYIVETSDKVIIIQRVCKQEKTNDL